MKIILTILLTGVVASLVIYVGAKIFWKVGFKELDNVLGKKFINLKKEKDGNKESK